MKVKELDVHLINKIAAGEVIERPASVVKELIENSLDAQSTVLEVSVEGGGIARIAVSDDGAGMTKEDLLLAVKRHTTSKIHTEADLENIKTLGFRGEALASIVEVSKTTIITKSDEAPEGTRLEIEGGQIKKIQAAGRARGTTVDVKELFFNTPARRKFLKKESTELYHIDRALKRFVLSHPHVHFRLFHGSKKILDSPRSADIKGKILDLYGAELAEQLLEISSESNLIKVKGFVSRPDASRADRSEQLIFINQRFVKDSALNYAIAKAYEGFFKDRHPIVFLFIEIDPQMVDVNVHPQKLEVRFANQTLVQGAVKKAISDALISQHAVPHLEKGVPAKTTQEVKHKEQRRLYYDESRELDLKQEFIAAQRASIEEAKYEIIGQIHNTYIVVQTPDGLELIDQHVAHERVLYEQLLSQITQGKVPKQRLLIPITIELPPDKARFLEKYLKLLDEKLGIGLEHFGGGSFILRDWPQLLADDLSKQALKDSIDKLLEALEHEEVDAAVVPLEGLAKRLAARVACEAAVVKNTPLTVEEMAGLVRQLKSAQNPVSCPHGRPIVLKYSLEELERRFGRR